VIYLVLLRAFPEPANVKAPGAGEPLQTVDITAGDRVAQG
jgi:hypothetical protein